MFPWYSCTRNPTVACVFKYLPILLGNKKWQFLRNKGLFNSTSTFSFRMVLSHTIWSVEIPSPTEVFDNTAYAHNSVN